MGLAILLCLASGREKQVADQIFACLGHSLVCNQPWPCTKQESVHRRPHSPDYISEIEDGVLMLPTKVGSGRSQ